jgi:uncharacterized membrane protein YgcG
MLLLVYGLLACREVRGEVPIEIFRTGSELIVRLERFDLLREAHPALKAVLTLTGEGGAKNLPIDLADSAVTGALVVDLSTFRNCTSAGLTVVDGRGKSILEKQVSPIPEGKGKGGKPKKRHKKGGGGGGKDGGSGSGVADGGMSSS